MRKSQVLPFKLLKTLCILAKPDASLAKMRATLANGGGKTDRSSSEDHTAVAENRLRTKKPIAATTARPAPR
jgi:hypothetical protein